MTESRVTRKGFGPVTGLLSAALAAWGFLAWGLWQELGSAEMDVLHAGVVVVNDALRAAPVQREIAAFIGTQLLIHAVMGATIWVLAWATTRCYPRVRWPIAVWAVLLLGAVYLCNAAQFPASRFASMHDVVTRSVIGTITVVDALVVAIGALALTVLARAICSMDRVRRHPREIAAAVLILTAGLLWGRALMRAPAAVVDASRPHVVIIGVDSLRPDAIGGVDRLGFAPNISSFRRAATSFPDAITPLSRTFASWSTILSGRHPVRSGARDALMPPQLLDLSPTLAVRMRAGGYATAYATDEVRFSNIDESFGFDRVVTPNIGVADFLVGKIADLPLSNLLTNTRAGAWLLPNVHGNRAVAATYRPRTFVDWLDRSVDFRRPTFLAVHLTLPHWPFYSADTPPEAFAATSAETYAQSVMAADRQFGQLMQKLEKRGVLANAIVVVLSDHGEALGLAEDCLIPSLTTYGHGTSVLSPSQYQVLLAVRRYRDGVSDKGQVSPAPASLEDIAPTVLAMVDLPAEARDFDGVSLAREVGQAGSAPELRSRVRFTETGLAPSSLRSGNLSEAANLREAISFFSVDADSGRIVFNLRRLPELLAQKERAVLIGGWQLAAIPGEDWQPAMPHPQEQLATVAQPAKSRQQYIFLSRSGGEPELVTDDPDSVRDPRFVALWQALQGRFGNEVRPTAE